MYMYTRNSYDRRTTTLLSGPKALIMFAVNPIKDMEQEITIRRRLLRRRRNARPSAVVVVAVAVPKLRGRIL